MDRAPIAKVAVILTSIVVCGAAAKGLAALLTPLILALFLSVLIDGFARFLQARLPIIPGWADLPLALFVLSLTLGVVLWIVVGNTAAFPTNLF